MSHLVRFCISWSRPRPRWLSSASSATCFLRLIGLPYRAFLTPMMMNNVGNIGLPVCLLAFGNAGLAYALGFTVVVLTAIFTIGIWLPSGEFSIRKLLKPASDLCGSSRPLSDGFRRETARNGRPGRIHPRRTGDPAHADHARIHAGDVKYRFAVAGLLPVGFSRRDGCRRRLCTHPSVRADGHRARCLHPAVPGAGFDWQHIFGYRSTRKITQRMWPE